ncbi:MAG: diguanylate cyclase [Nitrospirae bacterium]|nr:diguanylate cyclase [Nitrospirota bacterium]
MTHEIYLKDIDLAGFEEKVYVIAAEVLDILKELSRENQKQINSKTIAEKMFHKESVKNALVNKNNGETNKEDEIKFLKELANTVLDKFSELVPSHMVENLCSLKEIFKDHTIFNSSADWLDSPISTVKKYIESVSTRNNELEAFLKQTMQYLAAIEAPLTNELSFQQKKFSEDREFEDSIYKYMDMMREECNVTDDIESLKMAFINKIENINKGIEKKRERDIVRLKETEKTIEEMKKRMNEVKREADEIRKRSQEMEVETYRDALTGLHNRKAYDEKMEETLAHIRRYNVTASLMICDIDFFKKINDNFGHKVGDLALKKLAELLKERLRINDFISRYGGEEFAIVLPHTDMKGAMIAGESIRSYIDMSVFSYKNQKIPLTISVGISSFKKGDDVNTVFERSDKALYLAKKSGRNKVKTEDDITAEGTR